MLIVALSHIFVPVERYFGHTSQKGTTVWSDRSSALDDVGNQSYAGLRIALEIYLVTAFFLHIKELSICCLQYILKGSYRDQDPLQNWTCLLVPSGLRRFLSVGL